VITTTLAYFPSPGQGVWHLGPIPIRAYALFIIVGIIAALLIGDRRWEARGGERGVIYDIALWAVPFGLLGGRLYHVITDWKTYFGAGGAGPVAALRIWDGGLGIWGAVALGGVGAWIACRRRGIPLPAFGDAIAPGIVLAQAIGRLGNYFNQELYGRETTVPWGMEVFYRRDPSGIIDVHSLNGVSTGQVAAVVHPTFLYELLWNVIVFVALIYIDRQFKIGHGRLFALYVAGYCIGRFCVELLRDDFATQIAGVRINSFTSTFVFIGAIVYYILAPKGREDPATLGGEAAERELAADEPEDDVEATELAKELAAMAATTGVVAAATVAVREDDDGDRSGEGEQPSTGSKVEPEAEPEVAEPQFEDLEVQMTAAITPVDVVGPEPEGEPEVAEPQVADVEVESPVAETPAAVVVPEPEAVSELDVEAVAAETEEPEATAEAPTDADDIEESEDESILEAVVAAPGVETTVEGEEADLIDEDHDPVDEDDLESLSEDFAVVAGAGPVSEQQEELDASDEAESEADADDGDVEEEPAADQVVELDASDEAESEADADDGDVEEEPAADQVVEAGASDEPESEADVEADIEEEPAAEEPAIAEPEVEQPAAAEAPPEVPAAAEDRPRGWRRVFRRRRR
jgi:prolipoprotein diacylglyceryl transferase